MLSKLYNFWLIISGSLWFVPALFCLVFAITTLGLYSIERFLLDPDHLPDFLFKSSAEDAKNVVLALLSSMITMVTLSISITMVVLSLAASQLGPRQIKTFMSNRKTQYYIGLFFGGVIACFLVTMIIFNTVQDRDVPRLTLSFLLTVSFANLFVLLAFVHHVAESSIADNVILRVTKELLGSLDRLSTRKSSDTEKARLKTFETQLENWPRPIEDYAEPFGLKKGGYLQHIDYSRLLRLAIKQKLKIKVEKKPGDFLIEGQPVIWVFSEIPNVPKEEQTQDEYVSILKDSTRTKLNEMFILGENRTPTQDIEYSVRHLVEIALRALSPGINDSYTALTVLDRLSSALKAIFGKTTHAEFLCDDEGEVKVWANRTTDDEIIYGALNKIRLSAAAMPDVLHHLMRKIDILIEFAQTSEQKSGLARQLKEIHLNIENLHGQDLDVLALQKYCERLMSKLDMVEI